MARQYDSVNGRYVYPSGDRVDKDGIKSICNSIIDEAEKFEKAANGGWGAENLKDVSSDLSKSSKTLTVNENKYNVHIDTIKDEMAQAYKEIKAAAKAIKSSADSKYSLEKSQWNTYKARIDEEERKRRAAAAASSSTTSSPSR